MNILRLQELQGLLYSIPEDHFDLGIWLEGKDGENLEGKNTQELLGTCGTSGCAVGWACTHKPFNLEGLEYRKTCSSWSTGHVPTYRGYEQLEAVQQFFGICEEIAEELFYQESYPNRWSEDENGDDVWDIKPKDVAERIQLVVDNAKLSDEEILSLINKGKNNV